jgi:type I restriction enzyme S subunit
MIEVVPTLGRWPRAPLGELCDIRGGFPAPQDDAAFENGEIPFVRMKDVGRHHFTTNLCKTEQSLNRAHFEEGRYQLTPRGSILMPRSGSVGLNHRAILTIDAVIVSHLCALVPTSDKVTTDFLYRFLCLADMRKLTKKTTGLDSIAFSDLRLVAIPLPTLAEQRRIAEVLGRAEALRSKRRSALTQLDSLTESLFLEQFGSPGTNPKNWPRKSLFDLGKVVTGGTPPSAKPGMFDGPIPFVTPGDLESDEPVKRSLTMAGAEESRTVRAGATLVCCIGATIGKMGIAPVKSAFNQQLNAVEWFGEVDDIYGYATLRFFKPTIKTWGASTTLPILKKSSFEKIEIPIPPIALQQEFARRFQATEKLRAAQKASLAQWDELFGSLQSRAFKGEL